MRRFALACCGLALGALMCELLLRAALFGGHAAAWRMRRPGLYAHPQASEDYFLLQHRFGSAQPVPEPLYHPALGWVSEALATGDVERSVHRDLRALAGAVGRRPVLLYGDSYAHGTTPRGERIEDFFAAVDEAGEFALLNHGVQGYGLDQIVLLLEATLDHALSELGPAARPIVVLGVYVDDDLDRCALGLRGWPKPWFERAESGLELCGVPVPSLAEFRARRPLAIRSYLLRRFTHEAALWPAGWHQRWTGLTALQSRKEALVAPLVRRFVEHARARSVEVLALVFEGESRTQSDSARDWRDAALDAALDACDLRVMRSGAALRTAAAAGGASIHDCFGRSGPTLEHFNAEGNRAVAAALLAELRGLTD